MMLSALKHGLSIISRRVFLVSDDLAMEWTSLVNIVSETLKHEEVKARPEQRSIRVTKAAERQTELENDIGTERRLAARRRAHEWMRRTIRTIQANEEHVAADASVAATFRQVLFISVSVLHGQRTQVYSELTVDEFSKATRHPNGSRSAMRLAGKEAGKYGPATAIFPPQEVEFTEFFLSELRHPCQVPAAATPCSPGFLATRPSRQKQLRTSLGKN